jgi:rfaE bifunctional protein kinase chain/domain
MTDALQRMMGHTVVVIGDAMVDHYEWGEVERISPEAPVPIVRVVRQEWKLGGAGNVARNVAALGGRPTLVALRGEDEAGCRLQELCQAAGLHAELITCPERITTRKTRVLAGHQQMLRIDHETDTPLAPACSHALCQAAAKAQGAEVVVLSDYGKGAIHEALLQDLAAHPRVLLDPKTRNFPIYRRAYCMTPNTKEASEGSGIAISDPSSAMAAGCRLMERYGLQTLVLTMGAGGMAVFVPGEGIFHVPTVAQQVFDVTGAGDTVIATLALALAAGYPLVEAAILANVAAGIVVGKVGTAAPSAEEMAAGLRAARALQPEKWAELPA